jgi:isorenieratene synthase
VIIGAGVAGLTAAYQLAEQGLRPLLLEAHPHHVGGRLRSEPPIQIEHHNRSWIFPSEHGVHGIWDSYVNLKALLDRLNLAARQPSIDEAWIHIESGRVRRAAIGRALHAGPLPAPFHYMHLFSRPRFFAMLGLLDLIAIPRVYASLLVALGIDPIAEQNALRGMSLADFTKGWSPRLRSFFAGLARNALAAHPEDVPAAGFIAFLRFYSVARRTAWRFEFLDGTGGACVCQPLAAEIERLGASIELGSEVRQLHYTPGASWEIQAVRAGAMITIAAKTVILALDAPAAKQLLNQSPALADRALELWFPTGVPTAILRFWFAVTPHTPAPSGIFSGDVTADNFFWLNQIQPAFREWSRATGGSAVEIHIYGPPELLAQPDASLIAQAQQDLTRAFPETRGQVIHVALQRNPASHTLFGVAAADQHLGIITPWPYLFACGDWVAYPSPALYLERATTTGMAAANAVLRHYHLAERPLAEHPTAEPPAATIGHWIEGLRRRVRMRAKRTEQHSKT